MSNQRFNEPELYLLSKWSNARLLEESMNTARKKYSTIFDQVLDELREGNEELLPVNRSIVGSLGGVCLTKKNWKSVYERWPSGLWIDGTRLENLASEDGDPPSASVWVNPPTEIELNFKEVAYKLREEAKRVLSKEELARVKVEDGKWEATIYYHLPEPRQTLLEMLHTDEARGFMECMGGHFEVLSRFVPILDEIFQSSGRKRK
jgi:hypothetical protein